MRRLVVLIVLALVGAGLYGWAQSSTAVSAAQSRVTDSTFLSELRTIAATPTIQCYLDALSHTNLGAGAGGSTMNASGAATWANLRIEGLSVSNYVRSTFHYTPSAKDLAEAKSSLEEELTAAASSAQYSCPGTSATALADMPAEMRNAEIDEQAMSTYLVSRLDTTIPLDGRVTQDLLRRARLPVRHVVREYCRRDAHALNAFTTAKSRASRSPSWRRSTPSTPRQPRAAPTGASRLRVVPTTVCVRTWAPRNSIASPRRRST